MTRKVVEQFYFLPQTWADPRLRWDLADYENTPYLSLSARDIWVPSIGLRNRYVYHRQQQYYPVSKVNGDIMGPIWGRQDPGGPHVGPTNCPRFPGTSRCVLNANGSLEPLVEISMH